MVLGLLDKGIVMGELKRAIHIVDAGRGFSRYEMYVGKNPYGPHGGRCGNVVDGMLVATGTAVNNAVVAAMTNEELLAHPSIIDGREARKMEQSRRLR